MSYRVVCALLAAGALPLAGQPEGGKLPVKRVVLYKNGVGYFEHEGRVQGTQDVTIGFTSGQLNDVLKSLTVLDLGGGRITGVSYGSEAPLDRRLGDLRLPISEKTTLAEFLGALRGARLEIRNGPGSILTGRLLSVERKLRTQGTASQEVELLSLITDTGEVKSAELSPAVTVRLLDRDLSGTVSRYMDVVASAREADLRRMVVSTSGTGERSLFVSYISEVPVWKTTYRIVLPARESESPLLQGWAIVDNTVGEDWEKVKLSLVAGAPHSFVQRLSQPYYARRPEIGLPEQVSMAPQTHEGALVMGNAVIAGRVTDPNGSYVAGAQVQVLDNNSNVVGRGATDANGEYNIPGVPQSEVRVVISAPGFSTTNITGLRPVNGRVVEANAALNVGAISEAVTVTAEASAVNASSVNTNRVLGRGRALGTGRGVGGGVVGGVPGGVGGGVGGGVFAAAPPAVAAQELGDLFEYQVKEPITIRKNQSALVPIAQAPIRAEKVSLWNATSASSRPQRALWLDNSSSLTLDGGTFSVLEADTFAGEGIFESIKPGEKRLVSYATDLSVLAATRQDTEPQRVTRVHIAKGTMTRYTEVREKKTYTFRNEDPAARTLVIEHPVRPGYQLRSEAKPIETTAAWMRFRLAVPAKQTAQLTVSEARPVSSIFAISSITPEQVLSFTQQQSITAEMKQALERVLAQKRVVSEIEGRKQPLEDEKDKIYNDQQRLRENLKSLKGSAEEKALVQRYTRQLDEQENRLEKIEKEIAALEKQQEDEQAKLDRMIEELSFDTKL